MSKIKFTSENILGLPVPAQGRSRYQDETVPALWLQITSGGARSFYAYYRVGGKGDRKFIGDATMPLRKARKDAEDYHEQARHGEDPKARKTPAGTDVVRMNTVFDAYLTYCTLVRATLPDTHKDYLAPSTIKNHTSTFQGLKALWGDLAWSEVTDDLVLGWHAGQIHTPGRAKAYIERFREAWRWAREPARRVLPREAPSVEVILEHYKPHQLGTRTRRLSDAEITLMLDALDHFRQNRDHRVSDHALNYVELLLLLGFRKGQVAELRWVDDGVGNFVQFKGKTPWRFVFRNTKVRRKGTEYVVFGPDIAEVLLRFKRDIIEGNPFCFPSIKDPNKRTHIVDVRGLLKLLTDHAGIPSVMPHDFRRTGAAVGTRAGLSKEDIRKKMNHEDVKTTEGYMDLDAAAQAEAEANCANIHKVTSYIGGLRNSA